MYYVIRPWSGWQETFDNEEAALKRAAEIIENNEEQIKTRHNYHNPEQLVEEVWESLEEMYQGIA